MWLRNSCVNTCLFDTPADLQAHVANCCLPLIVSVGKMIYLNKVCINRHRNSRSVKQHYVTASATSCFSVNHLWKENFSSFYRKHGVYVKLICLAPQLTTLWSSRSKAGLRPWVIRFWYFITITTKRNCHTFHVPKCFLPAFGLWFSYVVSQSFHWYLISRTKFCTVSPCYVITQ